MQVYPNKFQSIVLCSRTTPENININFQIDGITIKPEKIVKLLGVYMHDNLKFHSHVSYICKQASTQISVLRRFSSILSDKEILQISNTFLLSNFNYYPLASHWCGPAHTAKMEKIQARALRFV